MFTFLNCNKDFSKIQPRLDSIVFWPVYNLAETELQIARNQVGVPLLYWPIPDTGLIWTERIGKHSIEKFRVKC